MYEAVVDQHDQETTMTDVNNSERYQSQITAEADTAAVSVAKQWQSTMESFDGESTFGNF